MRPWATGSEIECLLGAICYTRVSHENGSEYFWFFFPVGHHRCFFVLVLSEEKRGERVESEANASLVINARVCPPRMRFLNEKMFSIQV